MPTMEWNLSYVQNYEQLLLAFWIMLKLIKLTLKTLYNLVWLNLSALYIYIYFSFILKHCFLDYLHYFIYSKSQCLLSFLSSLFSSPGIYPSPLLCIVKSYITFKIHFKCYLFDDAFLKHSDQNHHLGFWKVLASSL